MDSTAFWRTPRKMGMSGNVGEGVWGDLSGWRNFGDWRILNGWNRWKVRARIVMVMKRRERNFRYSPPNPPLSRHNLC